RLAAYVHGHVRRVGGIECALVERGDFQFSLHRLYPSVGKESGRPRQAARPSARKAGAGRRWDQALAFAALTGSGSFKGAAFAVSLMEIDRRPSIVTGHVTASPALLPAAMASCSAAAASLICFSWFMVV